MKYLDSFSESLLEGDAWAAILQQCTSRKAKIYRSEDASGQRGGGNHEP